MCGLIIGLFLKILKYHTNKPHFNTSIPMLSSKIKTLIIQDTINHFSFLINWQSKKREKKKVWLGFYLNKSEVCFQLISMEGDTQ